MKSIFSKLNRTALALTLSQAMSNSIIAGVVELETLEKEKEVIKELEDNFNSSDKVLLKYYLEEKDNLLSPDLQTLNSKSGCTFKVGETIQIENIFRSTFDSHVSYVFLSSEMEKCPFDQGFINTDSVEKNKVFNYMPENYALFAKSNRFGVEARIWASSDAPVACETEPGEPLLVKGAIEIVSKHYIRVNVIPKYTECKEGYAFVKRNSVHLKETETTHVDSLSLTKPFYSPVKIEKNKSLNKAKWVKGKNRNAKTIKKLGLTRNMLAFLDVIAYAEGTKKRYDLLYTFEDFPSFYDHPRRQNCYKSLCSDAAGRYQLLSNTWDMIRTYLDLKDFSPRSQDLAAVQLIRWRKAAKLINHIYSKAQFKRALKKVSLEWASLPGSPYGQPIKSVSELWKVFNLAKKKYR